MKRYASLLISTLFLTSSFTWAKADRPDDLRYCLDRQSDLEIAKCAGGLKPKKTKATLSQNGQTVKGEVKSEDGEFSSHVLIVKSHTEIENWVKLEPSKRHVDVGHMRTVVRNEKIYFPVIATFTDSQVGKLITLEAELELVTPDGKVTKLQLEGAKKCCIANRVDPRAPTTIVLEPVIDITFDKTDLGGKYKLRAKINNGKETAVSEEVFSLSP